ncbi:MAG TPA: LamG domain-containing protein [Dehalococcoidia bacterium]
MSRSFVTASSQGIEVGITTSSYPFSMSAWFYLPSLPAADSTIMAIGSSTIGSQFCYVFVNSSGALWFGIRLGGSAVFGTVTGTVAANTWNHAALVAPSSGSTLLYLNGVKATDSGAGAGSVSPNNFTVGRNDIVAGGNNYLTGRVAEAILWSDALTDVEISALASGAHHLRVHSKDIVLYWPLYGTGSPEPDLSGNGHNGTLTNAPTLANHAPVSAPYPAPHTIDYATPIATATARSQAVMIG